MSIDTSRQGNILLITINRPEAYNALDPDAMMKLRDELVAFRDDPDLLVAVITGSGDKAFSTGADLKQTPGSDLPFAASHFAPYEQGVRGGGYVRALLISDLRIPKPIIAAINGHALGGGLEIALQCDVRISSPNATFGQPESRWASIPAVGGISLLLRALPSAVAMKLLLTGDRIDAAEAYRLGLVSDVVPSDGLVEFAMDTARTIASNGPLAVKAITELARRSHDLPLSHAIAIEQQMWGLLRDTADRAEGRNAFGERRAPVYLGR